MKTHQLWDFVRPLYEDENSSWRVIEIKEDQLTAELRANELEPHEVRRITARFSFFVSLEEEKDEEDEEGEEDEGDEEN